MPRISRDWLAGGTLLIVGAFFLAIELLPDIAFLIPLLVGLVLLAIFLVLRSSVFLTAGAIITGIGVGMLVARQGSPDVGGAGVLVSIGGGFLLVSVLAVIFDMPSARAWPIAPGLLLVTIGAVIYAAGLGREVLEAAVRWWPAVLVAIGAYLLVAARLRLPLYGEASGRHDDVTTPGAIGEETDHGPTSERRDRPSAEESRG